MKTINTFMILFILFTFGCGNKNTSQQKNESLPPHSGEIRITGAYALMPLAQRWVSEYQKMNPSVLFKLTPAGSGDAIQKILSGEADLTMVSSELPAGLDTTVWVIPVARLSTVIIANKNNPYRDQIWEAGVTRDNLAELFTGTKKCWGDLFGEPGKNQATVYRRSDQSGATDILLRYLWLENNELKGKGIEGENQLIETIKKDKFALGYCNFIYTFDPATKLFDENLVIIPLDINQNCKLDLKENFYGSFKELQRAMWLGKYPCTLNRLLQIAAAQKPDTKELRDFLKWVYTDGQKIVTDMGYMELRSNEVKYCLSYLEN